MGEIIHFISLVLAPLSPALLSVVLVAGFFFGMIYIYKLNVTSEDIFHIAMAGWVFLFAVFMFRLASYLTEGTLVSSAAGWLGIALFWGLYCGTINLGRATLKRFVYYKNKLLK